MCSATISTTLEKCDNRKTFSISFLLWISTLSYWLKTWALYLPKINKKLCRNPFGLKGPAYSILADLSPCAPSWVWTQFLMQKPVKLWIIQWLPCEFLLQVHENIWLIIEEKISNICIIKFRSKNPFQFLFCLNGTFWSNYSCNLIHFCKVIFNAKQFQSSD